MMSERRGRIAVIGGANMDIGGFPQRELLEEDSNPGRVTMTVGGVGRNIAENAARLGLEVELVSAFGTDENGRMLLEDCARKGIGTRGSLIVPGKRSSVYLFIASLHGDMHCAINDMEIQASLTPSYMQTQLDWLQGMDAVMLDANLPEETLAYLAQNLRVPLFADAVSVAKAGKLTSILPKLHALKPNRSEAELLSGMRIHTREDALRAARALNALGARNIFLTLGVGGALYCSKDEHAMLPNTIRSIQNATGAGDAFSAALVWAHCKGLSLRESCLAGMAAAAIALEAEGAVSPLMNEETLTLRMNEIRSCSYN